MATELGDAEHRPRSLPDMPAPETVPAYDSPDDLEPEHQFAVRFRSHIASAGVVVEDGWIWTRSGLLVAQARQLAVLVALPPR